MKLSNHDQQIALKLARQTLEEQFGLINSITVDYQNNDVFKQQLGLFVTLNKQNNLRGCLGLIETNQPLAVTIPQMSLAAAFNDFRFKPLSQDEFEQIKIEISILSKPQPTTFDQIELGTHGVIVKCGRHCGVFLPQVAKQTKWSKQEFFQHLCIDKAGLKLNCWQNSQARILSFTADVFSE